MKPLKSNLVKRRQFIKGASLSAIALSTTGVIHFDGTSYIGDCETTTDILGPFYRPNAPVRNNLVIEDMPGEIVKLVGKVLHDDCSTSIENAKVELWHCSAEEVYDNDTDEYNYRGTTFCNAKGEYHFITQMPVPYDAGGGMYRPAHFHLMISAPGYQNLITQLYFTGDPYLDKDRSAKSPAAKSRILEVGKDDKENLTVSFDIIMQKQLQVNPADLDRLVGRYVGESDGSQSFEFFQHENQLWLKNEVFGETFRYMGNNTFEAPDRELWGSFQVKFEVQSNNKILAVSTRFNGKGNKIVQRATKS